MNGKSTNLTTSIDEVYVCHLPSVNDARGNLCVAEYAKDIPFIPKRYFLVYDVPNSKVRGEHAHKKCHQFLTCVAGSCSVIADDGQRRQEWILEGLNMGIYLPPMIWGIQYRYTPGTVLLVLASDPYDSDDYVRDYNAFLRLKREQRGETHDTDAR